jgi:hypothetical protein
MPKTPGRRDNHPGRPVRAPDNHHAGRRPRERLLSVEGAHARNERTCIPAPVRMARPDELPAATLGFLHPALTSTPAATSSHSPPAEDGDRRAVSFLPCRYGTSGARDFPTATQPTSLRPPKTASEPWRTLVPDIHPACDAGWFVRGGMVPGRRSPPSLTVTGVRAGGRG